MAYRRNDERPIEVSVKPLAAALRNEQTAMACGAFEKPFGMIILR